MAETEGALTALDVLRRDGWHQGDYMSDGGRVCILGARNRAAGRQADVDAPDLRWIFAVRDVIREQFPDRPADLIHEFNDHPDTTFADVELVLEKAQIRLDEVTADV